MGRWPYIRPTNSKIYIYIFDLRKKPISKEHFCQYPGTLLRNNFLHNFLPLHKDTASYFRNTQCDHNISILCVFNKLVAEKSWGGCTKSSVKSCFSAGVPENWQKWS